MFYKKIALLFLCGSLLLSAGCGQKETALVDGYYTAEAASYSHGWKEFVSISVSGGNIVSVEYNAKNSSGFIKSWDIAYMESMNSIQGTYPNRYTRTYAAALLSNQSPEGIEVVAGASTSGASFQKLTAELLRKAQTGDVTVGVVEVE